MYVCMYALVKGMVKNGSSPSLWNHKHHPHDLVSHSSAASAYYADVYLFLLSLHHVETMNLQSERCSRSGRADVFFSDGITGISHSLKPWRAAHFFFLQILFLTFCDFIGQITAGLPEALHFYRSLKDLWGSFLQHLRFRLRL